MRISELGFGVRALLEACERVSPNRLEHREARLAVGLLLLAEQAVVDERRDSGESSLGAADRLCGLQRAAAREDGELREELTILRSEQVVAPVDRRAESLLPRRLVARAAREQLEAALQPGEQRLRREQLRPRGRQLDRQRQTVEADADLRDRRRVRRGDGEVGLHGPSALDEERDGLELGEVSRVGHGERRHLELPLAREPERRAARGQQLQARRSCEHVAQLRRRVQ